MVLAIDVVIVVLVVDSIFPFQLNCCSGGAAPSVGDKEEETTYLLALRSPSCFVVLLFLPSPRLFSAPAFVSPSAAAA